MQTPTMEEFARLSKEVKRSGEMITQLIDLVGTLGAEMRDGFRNQQAEMQSVRAEMQSIRAEMHSMGDEIRAEFNKKIDALETALKAGIEGLRHDLRSERRARGHWQAETEHRLSSLELRFESRKG